MRLSFPGYDFDFSKKTCIMGILNITPDSFSDGGHFLNTSRAVDRALQMEEEGADIIDVGGESTRPGAERVSCDEELKRTLPVIEALRTILHIPISIDTYKAEVASRAIQAGAALVNDISGLRFDPAMASVVASADVGVVVMHIKGTPRNMQVDPRYDDLLSEIRRSLAGSMEIARRHGIRRERIIVDPGIGFGKTPEHNLRIINNLDVFFELSRPILIGVSRKSFIGLVLDGAPPSARLEGTGAAVAIAVSKGAHIVRVHDVREMVRVARVADAVKRETI